MYEALLAIVCCIFLAGAYSGFETGCYLINRVRLRFRVDAGQRRAALLEGSLRDTRLFISTMLVGHNLAVYLASVTTTRLYVETGLGEEVTWVLGVIPLSPETAATLTLMLPFFLFSEVGPKNLFRTRANTLMYATAGVIRASMILFYPVAMPLRLLSRLVAGRGDQADVLTGLSRQRLRLFFAEGTSEGALTGHQNAMVTNVMAMRNTQVTAAMVPIGRAVCIPAEAKVEDFVALVRGRNISRAAAYEGSRAHIVGLVHVFDAMTPGVDPEDPVRPLIRAAHRISPKSSIQQALYDLQRHKQPIALVQDDEGQAMGLVTLQDLARRIVRPDVPTSGLLQAASRRR